jgi:hypothetical protein
MKYYHLIIIYYYLNIYKMTYMTGMTGYNINPTNIFTKPDNYQEIYYFILERVQNAPRHTS